MAYSKRNILSQNPRRQKDRHKDIPTLTLNPPLEKYPANNPITKIKYATRTITGKISHY
jgi:hypothetical protein